MEGRFEWLDWHLWYYGSRCTCTAPNQPERGSIKFLNGLFGQKKRCIRKEERRESDMPRTEEGKRTGIHSADDWFSTILVSNRNWIGCVNEWWWWRFHSTSGISEASREEKETSSNGCWIDELNTYIDWGLRGPVSSTSISIIHCSCQILGTWYNFT